MATVKHNKEVEEVITKNYRCPLCKQTFTEKVGAQTCIDSHISAEEIYDEVYEGCDAYPDKLVVRMADNTLVVYSFSMEDNR